MRSRIWLLSAMIAATVGVVACANAQLATDSDAVGDALDPDAPVVDAPDPDAPDPDAPAPDAPDPDAADPDAPEEPDASTCPRSPCDILEQCGCTAGRACDVNFSNPSSGTSACRNAGLDDEADECSNATECAAGYVCSGGSCRRYCDHVNETDNECPGAGGACLKTLYNLSQPVPNAPRICTIHCNPASQLNSNACPSGWACHAYVDEGGAGTADDRFVTDCDPSPGSGGGIGSPCTSNRDCGRGNDCVEFPSPIGKVCRPTCECDGTNCSAGACPSGGGTCHGYSSPLIIGNATYGVCY